VVGGKRGPQARVRAHAPFRRIRTETQARRAPERAAWELLPGRRMQDASDFSLPIEIALPERKVAADEHAATTPFVRPPLPPPRHAWPAAPTRAAVPSRIKARSLLPPPPTRATPLSDDDERRMQRRARAYRRQAWALRMLERFQLDRG
jgi:hypothetical protein